MLEVPVEVHRAKNGSADGVSPSPSLKAQEPGALMCKCRRWMFQLEQRICPSSVFCSVQALN